MKLKVIKTTKFEAREEEHTHYTCAHKGRVFGVNTLRFEEDEIAFDEEKMTVNIKGDVSVVKRQSTDEVTGDVITYLDLLPKIDFALAEF